MHWRAVSVALNVMKHVPVQWYFLLSRSRTRPERSKASSLPCARLKARCARRTALGTFRGGALRVVLLLWAALGAVALSAPPPLCVVDVYEFRRSRSSDMARSSSIPLTCRSYTRRARFCIAWMSSRLFSATPTWMTSPYFSWRSARNFPIASLVQRPAGQLVASTEKLEASRCWSLAAASWIRFVVPFISPRIQNVKPTKRRLVAASTTPYDMPKQSALLSEVPAPRMSPALPNSRLEMMLERLSRSAIQNARPANVINRWYTISTPVSKLRSGSFNEYRLPLSWRGALPLRRSLHSRYLGAQRLRPYRDGGPR